MELRFSGQPVLEVTAPDLGQVRRLNVPSFELFYRQDVVSRGGGVWVAYYGERTADLSYL